MNTDLSLQVIEDYAFSRRIFCFDIVILFFGIVLLPFHTVSRSSNLHVRCDQQVALYHYSGFYLLKTLQCHNLNVTFKFYVLTAASICCITHTHGVNQVLFVHSPFVATRICSVLKTAGRIASEFLCQIYLVIFVHKKCGNLAFLCTF